MKYLKQTILFLLVLSSSMAYAQVKFEAKVSKKKLGINERLRIDFQMNQDGDNFTQPNFQDFTVVGGPNQSVSNSWIQGKRTYRKTYSYFLAPKRLGNFTIKQASIEINGQVYKTSPIRITVTKAVDKPKDGNNADYQAAENIHLVAEVSNSTPYLNEAITVVYKLYVSPNTGVSNWREIDKPNFDDFWSQHININGLKILNGTYKGEDYRYVVLRKSVLYPQKTGKLNIDPLSLDITVDVPTQRRDIFGGRIMNQVHRTVSAGRRIINVKPLPEEGKPSDFTGAVGDFVFHVSPSKTELNATESLQLKLEVSGRGNLKLFELPKLNVPSSLEMYEPEHKENVRTNRSGMQGQISDSYTIVPQYKGKYPIPNISFSYFDLKTESYKRLNSNDIVINVLEGPDRSDSDSYVNKDGNSKRPVVLNQEAFAYIKTEADLLPKTPRYFFKSKLFWAGVFAPFIAIPLAVFYRRKKGEYDADIVGNRQRKADRLSKRYLGEAKKALGKKEAFYIALEKALHNYLKAKLNLETSDFSKDRIKYLLNEKQVETSVITEFDSLLQSCELARYTPITMVTMQADFDKAAKTIAWIDKQLR